MTDLRRPDACPACACTRILRIIYGLPMPETLAAAERGEVVLGGCCIIPGQPDWACSQCGHRWHDPTDPARQRLDAFLAERHSRQFVPPFPELRQRADGLRERVWTVKIKGRTAEMDEKLSLQLRDGALREYWRCLADQGVEGFDMHDAILAVRAEIAGPRSCRIAIARGGAAPNWDMAADTWVMHVLDTLAGPIVAWEGVPRGLWKLWPLPAAASTVRHAADK